MGADRQRLDVTFVRDDLERFCSAAATETIREFVNKQAAHWDENANSMVVTGPNIGGQVIGPKVSFGKIDTALDILSELVDKYTQLLTGSRSPLKPNISADWKNIFSVPWI